MPQDSISVFVFCIICFLGWELVVAQSPINESSFKRFSVRDGLIDNEVHALAQDSMGYIWCGTESGLSRFDGLNFISFNAKTNPNLLHGNYIEKLKSIDGDLLVFAREGFDRIQIRTMMSRQYEFEKDFPALEAKAAYDARFDKDGSALITTHTGFFEFDSKGKTVFSYHHFESGKKDQERIFFGQEIFKVSPTDVLFYAQDIQLYHYNRLTRTLQMVDSAAASPWKSFIPWQEAYTIKKELSDGVFLLLCFAREKYRYINLTTGVQYEGELPERLSGEFFWNSFITDFGGNTFAINCENNGFYTFQLNPDNGHLTFDFEKHLPEVRCYFLLVGADGRRWIGSNKGLWMEVDNPPLLQAHSLSDPDNSNHNLFLSGIARIGDTMILSSPVSEVAFVLFNAVTRQVLQPIAFANKELNRVRFIKVLNDHELLVVGNRVVYLFDLHTLQTRILDLEGSDLVLPTNDNPDCIHLLSSYSGSLYKLEKKTARLIAYPDSMCSQIRLNDRMSYDSNGRLWLAGHELLELDTSGALHMHPNANPEALGLGRYLSISIAADGVVWLGTLSGNLLAYDDASRKVTIHLEEDHMTFPIVSVSAQIDQTIFFSGGDRFYGYALPQETMIEISYTPGFPEEKVMSKQFVFNADSTVLYTTTINHLIGLNLRSNNSRSQISGISSIALDFIPKLYHPDFHFSLPYDGEVITLQIGNLDRPTTPQQVTYKLDNDEWRRASSELTFNKLSFGNHNLRVRYTFLFGEALEHQYQFTLIPPFYKSWWFRGLLMLALILVIGFEIRRRYLVRQKIWSLNLALAESEIKALHAQMNPHFIFNSLSSIKAMILDHRNDNASRYLSVFSSLIRQNLSHGRQPFITLDEQIRYIRQYLEIESLRNERLVYEIVLSEELDIMDLIPPMIIQPIVENAIWHGRDQDKSRHIVGISVDMEGQEIVCKVEDNGCGFSENISADHTKGNAMALVNIRQRVSLYNQKYNLQGSIIFVNKKDAGMGRGTLVIFRYLSDVHA